MEHICKNCKLFDSESKRCAVVILHDGAKLQLLVEAKDKCFFENEFQAINEKGELESFKVDINEIKMWCEDPKTGEKTDKGVVKIQFDEDFFGRQEP